MKRKIEELQAQCASGSGGSKNSNKQNGGK